MIIVWNPVTVWYQVDPSIQVISIWHGYIWKFPSPYYLWHQYDEQSFDCQSSQTPRGIFCNSQTLFCLKSNNALKIYWPWKTVFKSWLLLDGLVQAVHALLIGSSLFALLAFFALFAYLHPEFLEVLLPFFLHIHENEWDYSRQHFERAITASCREEVTKSFR